jgi:hypothetical protein
MSFLPFAGSGLLDGRGVVGWVGGGPACCARRAVRLIYAGWEPQDHGSSWGAAV